jgi:4-amino-4-deoxy-L-arabinose transferase-like glycosyltransferase
VAAARFDHAVPLACLAAAWAFQRAERTGSLAWFAAAGALVAGGVMIKIVPGMLLGAMFGWLVVFPATKRWRPMLPVVAGFGIALALLHAAFVAHWGDGYLASYTYHVKRGLQLESTFAGVIMAGHGFGGPLGIAYVSKAYDLETPFTGVLVSLSPALFLALAGVLAVRVAAARRLAGGPRRDFALVLLTIALLLAFMLTNKVFSPQYLLWLGPLFAVALAAERALWAPAVALLFAAGITQAIFPHFYDQLRLMQPWTVLLLNLRNLILVVLLGWLLWRLPRLLVAPPRS